MAYMSVDMWHLEETNYSDIILIVLYSKFTLLLHILFLTMAPLAIASYNSDGYAADRLAYMDKLMLTNDVLLVQEHWLMNSRISSLESSLHNVHVHGVSSMPDNEIITGRPYGGTAIISNKDLKYKITPISLSTVRACAVILNVRNIDIMLCNVYMTLWEPVWAWLRFKYRLFKKIITSFTGSDRIHDWSIYEMWSLSCIIRGRLYI